MGNIKKIFKPDVVFNDFIKTCWSDNIKTIDGNIPIHKELKQHGIFALVLEPMQEKDYFVFVLPINKSWDNEDLSKWREPILYFDIIVCTIAKLNVQLMDDKNNVVQTNEISINESEDWKKIQIPITTKCESTRLLNISGSVMISNFLIKDIVLKDK